MDRVRTCRQPFSPRGIFGVPALAQSRGKKISPDLSGIFFEDINFAADGGLYAELIRKRWI